MPGLPRVPAMQPTIGFIMHIPSTVRRADLPVPHAFLPHARVYPALSSSGVARRPSTITDSASRKTPQAPGNCPGARRRAGCEVSAIRSPLSSGLSPFLFFGCCFHERDAHTPRARLHRPESEQDQEGDAGLENGATLSIAALLATMAGPPAWASRPLSPYRSRPCGRAYANHSERVQECRRGVLF